MATKYKKIVVSAKKPLFGRQSEMDKEIAKWTSKGWELTDTTASNVKDHFRLSFEYAADEKGTSGRGRGCLIAFGVVIVFALISRSENPSTSSSQAPKQPTSVALVATAKKDVKPTEQPSKNLPIPSPTIVTVKTSIPATPTVKPTRSMPTTTPQPTVVLASVKSGNINARSCASTDCDIVGTVAAGEKVSVIGHEDNWYLVELKGNKSGYIRGDLLSISGTTEVAILPTTKASNIISPTAFKYLGSEAQDVELIQDYLNILTDDRKIGSVRVVNGRANGGERGAIIAYMTIESSDTGFLEEIFDILEAVYEAIDHYDMDIDAVTLVAGDKSGNAAGVVTVSANDLLAYFDGRINKQEFIEKLTVTSF